MEEIRKKFKSVYRSPVRGDETSTVEFEILEPFTVREMCEFILSGNEWGYIGIKQGDDWFPFGNPKIEYTDHQYYDGNCTPIKMNFPESILNATIKRMWWNGGWTRGDWLFEI